LRRKSRRPFDIGEPTEPGRLGEGKECRAFRAFGIEVDDLALQVFDRGARFGGRLRGECRCRRWSADRIEPEISFHPRAVNWHRRSSRLPKPNTCTYGCKYEIFSFAVGFCPSPKSAFLKHNDGRLCQLAEPADC